MWVLASQLIWWLWGPGELRNFSIQSCAGPCWQHIYSTSPAVCELADFTKLKQACFVATDFMQA